MPRTIATLVAGMAVGLVPAAAGAVCAPGAPLLRVPEDCATVAAAVAALADGGTVDLAPGPAPLGGLPLVLSNSGRELTLRARTTGTTTFAGGGASPIVVIDNSTPSSGGPIVFEGIRFAGGRSAAGDRAGGVTLRRAEATFADCEFEDNAQSHASTGGGALALLDGSRALVVRSRFAGNRARNQGGAIYAVRNAGQDAVSLWIAESDFDDNSTAATGFTATAAGGAIYARNAAVRIADARFEANLAGRAGGALYAAGVWGSPEACDFDAPAADLLVVRSELAANRADDAADPATVGLTFGGAIHAEGCARLRLHASRLEANAADRGGAVALDHARMVAEQTIFRHNRATLPDVDTPPLGGAVAAFTSSPGEPLGELELSRVLFVGGFDGDPGGLNANSGGCLRIAGDATARRAATIADTLFSGCNAGLLLASAAAPNVRGGAVEAKRADLVLERVLFLGNTATGTAQKGARGGGIALDDSPSTWSDGVLAGNTATQGDADLQFVGAAPTGGFETWSEAPPATAGVLVAAPSRPAGPGGPFAEEAGLGGAWRGAAASLDGESLSVSETELLVPAAPGAHELEVSGLPGCARCATTVLDELEPATTLVAAPEEIAGGGSSILAWTTPAGDLLAALVDRGVGTTGASGDAEVGPGASSTYRRLALTAQGGALAEARVYVDEEAPDPIFVDGFESGLAAWQVGP